MLLQVEDLALAPAECVRDGNCGTKLFGQALADRVELLTGDEPGARRSLGQLLDERQTRELRILVGESEQLAQSLELAVDSTVGGSRDRLAFLICLLGSPFVGIRRHDIGRDRGEPALREERVKML